MRKRISTLLLSAALFFCFWLYIFVAWDTARMKFVRYSPDLKYLVATRALPFWGHVKEQESLVIDTLSGKRMNLNADYKAWSPGTFPVLAATCNSEASGPKLLLYFTKNGNIQTYDLPKKCSWIMSEWSQQGQNLFLYNNWEVVPCLVWNSQTEMLSLIKIPENNVIVRHAWLGESRLLIKTTTAESLADTVKEHREDERFLVVDILNGCALQDISSDINSYGWVENFASDPSNADILLMRMHPKGEFDAGSESLLVNLREKKIMRRYAPGASSFKFTEDGRILYYTAEKALDEKTNKEDLVIMDLSDYSEKVAYTLNASNKEPWFRYIVHPDGGWSGLIERRNAKTIWGCRVKNTVTDSKCLKDRPLQLALSGWFLDVEWFCQGKSHFLLGISPGPLFPKRYYYDPITCTRMNLKNVYDWPFVFKSGSILFWLSFFGFMVNSLLFSILIIGKGSSEGQRPLAFFFWSLAVSSAAGLLPNLEYGFHSYNFWGNSETELGPLALWSSTFGYLLVYAGISFIPMAIFRFATEFPASNAYKIKYPVSVRISRTTISFIPLFVLIFLLADHVRSVALAWSMVKGINNDARMNVESAAGLINYLMPFVIIVGILFFIFSIAAIIHNYRFAPNPKIKNQLRIIMFGFSAFLGWNILGIPIWTSVIEGIERVPHFLSIGFFSILAILPALFCGYALLSKELLDISFVVRRTIKYTIVTLLLAGIFFGTIVVLSLFLPRALGWGSQVGTAIATVIAMLAFQPLRVKIQDWVDRKFDKAKYDARKALSELASRLSTIGSTVDIADTVIEACNKNLKTIHSSLFLLRDGEWTSEIDSLMRVPESSLCDAGTIEAAEGSVRERNRWVKAIVPVIEGERLFGFIALGEKLSQDKFSSEDMELVKLLAREAGVSLQNMNLVNKAAQGEVLKRDLEEARLIQERYFPKTLPDIPGYSLFAVNRPARIVGGDYYDAIPLPGGRFAFIVADVSGKGMPAALRVAEIRSFVHAVVTGITDPADVLNRLNRHLCGSGHKNEFTTFFFALLDARSNTFNFSGAGHIPPVFNDGGGRTLSLRSEPHLPLGMNPSEGYSSAAVSLERGSFLVLMTDGLPERKDISGELLGFDPIEKAAASPAREASAEDLTSMLLDLGEEFSRGLPADDDITLLILKRRDPVVLKT